MPCHRIVAPSPHYTATPQTLLTSKARLESAEEAVARLTARPNEEDTRLKALQWVEAEVATAEELFNSSNFRRLRRGPFFHYPSRILVYMDNHYRVKNISDE
jgi:membrane-bound lytic murein transglycosylase MltF